MPRSVSLVAAIRVGIVDDDEHIRRLLVLTLELDDRFAVVGEAADVDAALQLVDANALDVVVLDLKLGDRSGLEVLDEIRRTRPSTDVVVFSGDDAAETREEVAARGGTLVVKGSGTGAVVDALVAVADRSPV